MTTGVLADDVIEPDRKQVAPLAVLTDGTWAWLAELAYYVATYYCEPPPELVDHMRSSVWRARDVSESELNRLVEELMSAPS